MSDTKRIAELAGIITETMVTDGEIDSRVGFLIKGTSVPMYLDYDDIAGQNSVLLQVKKSMQPHVTEKMKKNGYQQVSIDVGDLDKLIKALKKIQDTIK